MVHLNVLLDTHKGDAEHKLKKALQQNNIDVGAYHGGSIMGNYCMYMAQNGDKMMDAMTIAMASKLRDPANQRHLQDASVQMKQILKLWFEIMRATKSKEY